MKYKTLAELKAAYDSSLLDSKDRMVLDNDCVHVWTFKHGDFIAGEPVAWSIFDAHPEQVLRDALDLLGIPWKDV